MLLTPTVTPSGLTTRIDNFSCRQGTLDLAYGKGIFDAPGNITLGPYIGGVHYPVIL